MAGQRSPKGQVRLLITRRPASPLGSSPRTSSPRRSPGPWWHAGSSAATPLRRPRWCTALWTPGCPG